MKDVLFVDIETQSAVDIKNVLHYVSHPSTQILCAVAKTATSRPCCWIPSAQPRFSGDFGFNVDGCDIRYAPECPFPTDIPWVAHNAHGFDSLIWERQTDQPQPPKWIDTIPMCRAAGLPGKLENVSQILFGEGKEDNSVILKTLCTAKPNHRGGYQYNAGTRPLWEKLIKYTVKDVLLLQRVWEYVLPYFNEWELMDVSHKINSRGIKFDKKFALLLWELWGKIQDNAFDYIDAITDHELKDTDLRSPIKVKRWLASKGYNVPSLNKQVIDEYLTEYDDSECEDMPLIEAVIEARETVSRGSKGKVERLLEIALNTPDQRLRHWSVMNGAHTGRYSGRGFQPHNLARPIDPNEIDRLLKIYTVKNTLTPEDLGAEPANRLTELTRAIFHAPEGYTLDIGDYAQIEARALAWLTGESSLLRAFQDNSRDVYCEMATRLFGRKITKADNLERQAGKVVVLACGYGMGKKRLQVYCTRNKPRIDLPALGLSWDEAIRLYRESVPRITAFWKRIEIEIFAAVSTQTPLGQAFILEKGLQVFICDGHLIIKLPSQRNLVYRNCRIESRVPNYVKLLGLPIHRKPTLVYDHPHGYPGILYGGLITENIIQAICRDLLADALIGCSRYGEKVVLHVHDEIMIERTLGGPNRLHSIMSSLPGWASGFPMKVDVYSSERYVKK